MGRKIGMNTYNKKYIIDLAYVANFSVAFSTTLALVCVTIIRYNGINQYFNSLSLFCTDDEILYTKIKISKAADFLQEYTNLDRLLATKVTIFLLSEC